MNSLRGLVVEKRRKNNCLGGKLESRSCELCIIEFRFYFLVHTRGPLFLSPPESFSSRVSSDVSFFFNRYPFQTTVCLLFYFKHEMRKYFGEF